MQSQPYKLAGLENIELNKKKFAELVIALQQGNDELFEQFIYFAYFENCINYLKKNYNVNHNKAYSYTVSALLKIREELIKGNVQFERISEKISSLLANSISNSKIEKNNRNEVTAPKNKNFDLTEKEFNQLVHNLQQGNEKLFELIYLSHFNKCLKFLINYRSADYEMAYTSTMNALLSIRKDLINGKIKYGNLAYYYTYRACRVLSKLRKKGNNKLKFEDLENKDFQDQEDLFQTLEKKEIKNYVKLAIGKLEEECKRNLILYYYNGLKWHEIAKLFFPNSSSEEIKTKSNTIRRKTSRKCLPAFKVILKTLVGT